MKYEDMDRQEWYEVQDEILSRLAAAEKVVEAAFKFAAGFDETISRVNISNLRAALTAAEKVKGVE